jgi:hypothetical protein
VQLGLSIAYLDQKGNPMLVTPTPDVLPVWTNSTPATETLSPSADGLTCDVTTVAVGQDVISLAVIVSGADFSATLNVNVLDEPQVLTSVAIVAAVK